MEEQRIGQVDEPTQPESSREERKIIREVDRLVQDVHEHVGAATSLHRKRISLDIYTSYMVLMIELIDSDLLHLRR